MKFKTINPATEDVIAEFELMSRAEVFMIVESCDTTFQKWRTLALSERITYVQKLATVLRDNKEQYAKIITTEMGKPISESFAEIEKCAWAAEVYAKNAEEWLSDEPVAADGIKHSIVFQPLGVILSIMPWNFPFWQALRFGIPTTLAGNTSILKHSNTVPQCALAIEDAFLRAGFPRHVFSTVLADHDMIADLIRSKIIVGVSFTGSTEAGSRIAKLAGENLKKSVLELGGSDPFIILDDADVTLSAKNAVLGRSINTGQSCIAAKRFIVAKEIVDEFSKKFAELMSEHKLGDPLDDSTTIGPLVNNDSLEHLDEQVNDAINKGAEVLIGGKRVPGKGYYYEPTILTNIGPDMKVAREEVFGPVAPIIVVNDDLEAVQVANSTEFGLGGSVWTKDVSRGEHIARQLEAGAVFVNSITKSDPRMPFGGVKKSGFGRELSKFGLKEFVNIKGLSIYEHI